MAYIVLPLDLKSVWNLLQSWRVLLLIYTLPSILGFLGLIYLPESPKFLLAQGRHDESQEILRHVYHINTKKPETLYQCSNVILEEIQVADAKGMWKQTLQLFVKERIFQTINMSIINFTICVIGVGITMWLPTILFYLENNREQGKTVCGIMGNVSSSPSSLSSKDANSLCPGELDIDHFVTLIWISASLFVYYLVSSAVVDFLGKKRLLVVWFALGTVSAFTMYWSQIYFYSIVALTLICQMGKFHGIVLSIAADYYPPSINAMGVCFITMVSNIGLVVGGNITGALFLSYCNYMFFGCGVLMIIIIVCTLKLPKECSRGSTVDIE